MSFYDENILFIKSKLVCELNKTKNEADKYEKYIANFKDETRNRLLKSYTSSVVKGKFYLEISKYLYDVEADYILLNLYFEQNFHNLLNILISKHAFKKVLKNCHSNIVNTLYNNRLFRNATIRNHKEIIKEQFNLLINIPKGPYNRNPYKEFINVEENNFDLIYSYSWWIINRISQEKVPETTIISFLLFTKLWNIFPEFHSIKPNMIAISLLNKINNDFKLKVDELCVPKLYEFNNLTSNIFDSLFVNTKMASPITLDYDYSYYTKGYYKQKEIYF